MRLSAFRGLIRGRRGEATRLGSSDLTVEAQTSRHGKITVSLWHDATDRLQTCEIALAPHLDNGESVLIYRGLVASIPAWSERRGQDASDLARHERHESAEIRRLAQEIGSLRLSLQRVAQATESPEIIAAIPPDGYDRGWNYLAGKLTEHVRDTGQRLHDYESH